MILTRPQRTAIVRHVALGVGVGIVPWNFPLTLGVGKLFPALLMGNTFIWKPSPFSPYTALKLAEIGVKIFPPGVFQALSGEDNLGPWLTEHPGVAKVSFTGSVETGKKIMVACATTVKRLTLELGGNDAAIVCDDVNIDSVVRDVRLTCIRLSSFLIYLVIFPSISLSLIPAPHRDSLAAIALNATELLLTTDSKRSHSSPSFTVRRFV